MAGLLDGHTALITGGGSGIGRGIALKYADQGAAVIAVDINQAGAAETVGMIAEKDAPAWSFALDVSDVAGCRALAEKVAGEIGDISILVNNAGIVRRNAVTAETAKQDWDDVIAVNLTGLFNVTTAFLDQLRATKGRIINIGSIQSFVHTPNSVAYTASKGGVKNFTTGLAAELGPDGIRVNAIGPGLILTPLNEAARRNNPDMEANMMRHTPLGRPGAPEDIAGPAVFLASDLSAYVTGVTLPVDGGYLTI
jgi:NAD(P)-dependent dehydrogenase (short-subunit alcohol dehydrogenase family)